MRPLGTVLITGGASGLGAATVAAVRAEGGRPLVIDRVASADGVDHVQADLADRAATEAAVAHLAEDWERVVAVNLFGTARVVRAALPHLERSHGTVVTCASTLGIKAVADATAYCAAKFGVVGFTRALAAETAGRVGVTLLVPGGMHTAFFDDRAEQYKPPPDAKLNRPEDVAATVVFALRQPPGCQLREMVVCSSEESSWP